MRLRTITFVFAAGCHGGGHAAADAASVGDGDLVTTDGATDGITDGMTDGMIDGPRDAPPDAPDMDDLVTTGLCVDNACAASTTAAAVYALRSWSGKNTKSGCFVISRID